MRSHFLAFVLAVVAVGCSQPQSREFFQMRENAEYGDTYSFSLDLCFYEALVGQVPWTVKGFDIATKKIVPASKLAPFIPEAVDALIENALKEDPNERTQSVTEFWKQLEVIEPLKEDDPSKTHY